MSEKPDGQERAERFSETLLVFVDILYAVVFGLILADTFERVINNPEKSIAEKASLVLLVASVFYFLAWDWLHGRLLTIKNPYRRYRRFFLEVLMACCAYGAALNAVQGSIDFLPYLSVVLLAGVAWARFTLQEYPESADQEELGVVRRLQLPLAGLTILFWIGWRFFVGPVVNFGLVAGVILIGWAFVLWYELEIERPLGLFGGPGVPFLPRTRLAKMREVWRRYRHGSDRSSKKGGIDENLR